MRKRVLAHFGGDLGESYSLEKKGFGELMQEVELEKTRFDLQLHPH